MVLQGPQGQLAEDHRQEQEPQAEEDAHRRHREPVPAVGQLAHQKQQQEQGGLDGQIQGEIFVPEKGGQRELPEEHRDEDQAQAEDAPHGRPREPGPAVAQDADQEQQQEQSRLHGQVEGGLPPRQPLRPRQGGQERGQEDQPRAEEHRRTRHGKPCPPGVEATDQKQELQPHQEGGRGQMPLDPLRFGIHDRQGRHQGGGGGQPHRRQDNPEPAQGPLRRQVADGAAQQHGAEEDVEGRPVVPGQAEVLGRQAVGGAALRVLAGGEQLMLGDPQHGADVPEQCHVRVAHPPLPFADGGLRHVQLLGELPLGQAHGPPPLPDVLAEGFFTFHVEPPQSFSEVLQAWLHCMTGGAKSQPFPGDFRLDRWESPLFARLCGLSAWMRKRKPRASLGEARGLEWKTIGLAYAFRRRAKARWMALTHSTMGITLTASSRATAYSGRLMCSSMKASEMPGR